MVSRIWLCPVLSGVLVSALAAEERPVDFTKDVRPIFREHCYDCHGAETQKSGFRLDVGAAALRGGSGHAPDIIPKDAAASPLIQFVRGEHGELRMPPEGRPMLSGEEIAMLEKWIDGGAEWPESADDGEIENLADHWSFVPVERPEPPSVKNEDWPRGEIDRFVLARLEESGLKPSEETGRISWLRRVTFDLTGLPPTPEEIAEFVADESEDAFSRVVDRLLASPRYGERWGQHWLDVVRYADTHGFEVNTERANAWPYRDYVIEAFNEDLPYDQFIREQLAGDQVGKDAATGFLVTSAVLLPGQIGKDEESKRLARQDELTEMVVNVGEAFLGLSIGCARCHDHKFDAISAKDFYSMQAFLSGVEFGDRPMRNPEVDAERERLRHESERLSSALSQSVPAAGAGETRPAIRADRNIERFAPVETSKVRLVIEATNKLEPCIDELEVFDAEGRNVALASRGAEAKASGSRESPNRHGLAYVNDGVPGNSSSWMSDKDGEGWVEVTLSKSVVIDRVHWGRDRLGKFKDRLATDYRVEVWKEDKWQVVATSDDRLPVDPKAKAMPSADLLAVDQRLAEIGTASRVYAGKFKQPEPIHLLNRGDPEQPKDEVEPAVLSALGSDTLPRDSADGHRRAALADWIASPENALTARVMVNRIWQWHFGIGLVETANDFGRAGAAPSHLELLDWLASEFVRSDWSMKHLHRLIVLSSTYRQSSRVDPEAAKIDRDARLLWRFPSRRLEAEAIRDSILATSGRLNLEMGGRGFDLFKTRGGLSGFPPIEEFDEKGRRRMIYAHKIRMERGIVFGAFDCPDAGQSQPRRRQSTTPIQALNLFNSRFVIDEAEAFAIRIIDDAGPDRAEQIDRLFLLAYGRAPDPEERRDALAVASEHGLATVCRAVFNSNEFLFLP